jgi:arylsulfatase A-like enzyme
VDARHNTALVMTTRRVALDIPTRLRHFVRPRLLILLLATAVCPGAVWWQAARVRSPIGIVIISLDTTRADRLSVYGFMDATMPHLERLAREGTVFDQAISVAPLTLPAHCSLFTGLFPPAHGVRDNADQPLASEQTTLAEILRGQGFRTGAFVGSIVLDEHRGLAQGFDHYSGVRVSEDRATAEAPQRRADEVVTDATRWLDGIAGSRFFLWAHLYDPHRPYDPPEPFRSRYTDRYVGELAFVDSQIGRLLEALDRRKLLDRTIVVVVADHGESLGDHGERDHGIFVYESVMRVPLIIRGPTVLPGRIADVVRLVDVMPTVLDLLNLARPPTDGVSLVATMRGAPRQLDLEAYSESLYPQRFGWSSLRSLRSGRYTLIDAPRPELYDLEQDPFEERNIYNERRDLAALLKQRLAALERSERARSEVGDENVPSAELQQRLASLGYVGSRETPASPHADDLPDPKDCVAGAGSLEELPVRANMHCGRIVNRFVVRPGATTTSR